MKRARIWLVVLSLLSIVSIVFSLVYSQAVQEGKMAKDWSGVFGLLMAGSVLANVFVTYRYAQTTGRSAVTWAAGALLLPYIVPIVLALQSLPIAGVAASPGPVTQAPQDPQALSVSSLLQVAPAAPRKDLFTTFPMSIPVFLHKEGLFKKSNWRLDHLRLFSIILPASHKWRVVAFSQTKESYFPDLMPEDAAESLYGLLEWALVMGDPDVYSGITLSLAGFDNQGGVFQLRKMEKTRAALLSGLYHFRRERRNRLQQWLSGNPDVILRGWFGKKAILNKDGFHVGKKRLSWPEVKCIQTETSNGMFTHLYVLPEGRSGGIFDLKRGKYSLVGIPTKNRELYIAECNFWRTFCAIQ